MLVASSERVSDLEWKTFTGLEVHIKHRAERQLVRKGLLDVKAQIRGSSYRLCLPKFEGFLHRARLGR